MWNGSFVKELYDVVICILIIVISLELGLRLWVNGFLNFWSELNFDFVIKFC